MVYNFLSNLLGYFSNLRNSMNLVSQNKKNLLTQYDIEPSLNHCETFIYLKCHKKLMYFRPLWSPTLSNNRILCYQTTYIENCKPTEYWKTVFKNNTFLAWIIKNKNYILKCKQNIGMHVNIIHIHVHLIYKYFHCLPPDTRLYVNSSQSAYVSFLSKQF